MERRHEWALMNRIEEALLNGCAHITEKELKLWYGAQRLGISIWRDLRNRWHELGGAHAGEIKKIEGRDGIYILAADRIKSIIL